MKTAAKAALALLLFSSEGVAAETPSVSDLKRAKTWKPRDEYRGQGNLARANAKLNGHLLKRADLKTKACEAHTKKELQATLRTLFKVRNEELMSVYAKHDGRRSAYASQAEMEKHWSELPEDDVDGIQRDAHCHEAVMWFTHHLTEPAQAEFAKLHELPLLPTRAHSTKGEDPVTKLYSSKVTCQACHVGGIDSLHVPEVAPATEKAKQRRCYTNYKELFNIDCGPCDGIAGPYWGDSDDKFKPTECHVVAQPHEVPEGKRVHPKLPPQFTVDVVGGSDRFGRTTNPVHDQLPGPIAKLYGQIYGKWFMDARADSDLWLLRHDTTYASVTEDGTPIPFIKPHVSEIHAQTSKQRSMNLTGPMVSLINGLPAWMPGGCTCMPDPVGVPDTQHAFAHGLGEMQYMGRIKLPELEYLKVPIELDHWASWFFHIFMDTNTSQPHYGKAPSRLASAYAGTAVYANWIMEDPKIRDPEVWHRGIPTSPEKVGPSKGKFCMDTHKSPMCSDISQATFPPKPEPAVEGSKVAAKHAGSSGLPFFPVGAVAHTAATQAKKEGSAQVFI
eukprot:TRINITY_DN4875_c1_g2_i1.p1 TRINITY_DN4875_c1_g2~~TRINITY_DN4875_c1_g2_i1.p1  ORF type:complete len:560 (-),score=135.72 TRINITY_DN4875_c1_g2_i1:211-1890(-)